MRYLVTRRFLPSFVFLLSLVLLGCGGDEDTPPGSPPDTQSPGSAGSPGPTPGGSPPAAPITGIPTVRLERVFSQLSFQNLTGLYQAPDGTWFVTEKAGRVLSFEDDAPEPQLVADLTDRVNSSGQEEGLLGLALAPDFSSSGHFYLYYTASPPRRAVLSRFQMSSDVEASETVLLEVEEPFANHNGGQIAFGPEGYLYVGVGDGGGGNDPQGNGQNTGTLLGSVLRIDIAGGGEGYRVPPDNPFAGQPGARGEIWAHGLRNPWRFSFDRETDVLWLGDVGQNSREEIDIITRGGNYGWNVMEGAECRGGGDSCDSSGLIPPVFDYPTDNPNCSVTGGFVYRGGAIAGLRGAYVFSDYCSGILWALREQNGVMTEQGEVARSGFQLSSFGQGNDGELYALQFAGSGGIFKLVP
jgi:glucose/arabinose dehydrogenase